MAIAYRIRPTLGLTVTVWDGIVTVEDTVRYQLSVAANAAWPPGPLSLVDMRTVREYVPADVDLTYELLASSDQADVVRHIAVLALPSAGGRPVPGAEPFGVNAARFYDLGAACDFLGVPAEHVAPVLDEIHAELRQPHD